MLVGGPFGKTEIAKWKARLGVRADSYFLQRMKTKWGICNPPTARASSSC